VVDTLTVHLSRGELHEVEPATADFETSGRFEVAFVNHGRAAHVHVHPDDALARGVRVAETNLFVETDSRRVVGVEVPDGPRPLRGALAFSAGYGAGEATVDVGLVEDSDPDLPVDETLAEPAPADDAGSPLEGVLSAESLPVLGLGAVALVLAVGAALAIGDAVVVAGALAVLAGVAVALYSLLGD